MRVKSFVRSLLVTSMVSFAAPLFLIGAIIVMLTAVAHVPNLETLGQVAIQQVFKFLAVFGNGNAIEGALVIALTCGLVGALFDTYAYCNRSLRSS